MKCPSCGAEADVTEISCPLCHTSLIPTEELPDRTALPRSAAQSLASGRSLAAFSRRPTGKTILSTLIALILVLTLVSATALYLHASSTPRSTHTSPMSGRVAAANATSTVASTSPPDHTATPRPGASPTPDQGNRPGSGGTNPPGSQGPTPPPGSGFTANQVSVVVHSHDDTTDCPTNVDMVFTAWLTVTLPMNSNSVPLPEDATAHLLYSDGRQSPDIDVPFHDGNATQQFVSERLIPANQAGHSFWAQAVITSPNSLSSGKANFTFHCPNIPLQDVGTTVTASTATYDCTQTSITVTVTAHVTLFDNPPDLNPNGYTFYYGWVLSTPKTGFGSPQMVQAHVPVGALTWSNSFSFTINKSDGNGTYMAMIDLNTEPVGVPIANGNVEIGVSC